MQLHLHRLHPTAVIRRFHPSRLFELPHLIRFRLTLWYTGLAAVVLAVFVWVVFYAFSQYQQSVQDYTTLLQTTLDKQVQIHYAPSPALYPGAGTSERAAYSLQLNDPNTSNKSEYPIAYFTADGKPLTDPTSNPALNSQQAKQAQKKVTQKNSSSVSDYAKGWKIITIPLSYAGEKIIGQIAVPEMRDLAQVDELKYILVYSAGILLVISAAGGWMLSGRALKPVDEITRRAQQITAHDLSQRLSLTQEDELGRMASTFDDMIARLEEAFARQKRFTSDASHELRTPLTVMQADLGLALARPRSPEEYRDTLVSMDEEVGRLSTIVGDLLTLTRIDVDPATIQHEPVALDELLRTLVGRVNVIAAERDITLCAEGLAPVTVTGDPTRLRQLFTNLLHNAVTYTPDGGQVTVTLEQTREGACARVSDTGIGIASDHLPRIFERFYRTDEARAQNAHGTGLGLAISRSVAQAHHGEITVESEQGRGTTFTVTLPSDSRKPVRRIYPKRLMLAASGK